MERYSYLRDKGPTPRVLEGNERLKVARFIGTTPGLIDVRQEGLERFLGRTSTLPDGRLLLVFLGRPDRKTGNPLSFFVWGSPFGGCLRLVLRMRPHPKQAVLIPPDPEFAALKLARVVIAFWRLGKLYMSYELDYRSLDHARALADICEGAEENHQAVLDEPAAFWDRERILANSVSETFQSWFTRRDWLQLGWIKESRWRIPRLLKIIADLPNLAEAASEWALLQEYPVLYSALMVAKKPGPARERLRALLEFFANAQIAPQFLLDAVLLFEPAFPR